MSERELENNQLKTTRNLNTKCPVWNYTFWTWTRVSTQHQKNVIIFPSKINYPVLTHTAASPFTHSKADCQLSETIKEENYWKFNFDAADHDSDGSLACYQINQKNLSRPFNNSTKSLVGMKIFHVKFRPKPSTTQRMYTYHIIASSARLTRGITTINTQHSKKKHQQFFRTFSKNCFSLFCRALIVFQFFWWIFHSLSKIDNFFLIVWSLWIFFFSLDICVGSRHAHDFFSLRDHKNFAIRYLYYNNLSTHFQFMTFLSLFFCISTFFHLVTHCSCRGRLGKARCLKYFLLLYHFDLLFFASLFFLLLLHSIRTSNTLPLSHNKLLLLLFSYYTQQI